jgi:cytoskeletal protein RodZ
MMEDLLHPSNWPLVMVVVVALAYALLAWLMVRRRRLSSRGASQRPQQIVSSGPQAATEALSRAPVQTQAEKTTHPTMIDRETAVAKTHDVEVHAEHEASDNRSEAAEAVCARLLGVAQSQVQSGQALAAAATLREAIHLAASIGLTGQHAAARLELGELARLDGDLITACEHWQIARGLFHDLGARERVKAAETRMREHGCPTDWVLNDF